MYAAAIQLEQRIQNWILRQNSYAHAEQNKKNKTGGTQIINMCVGAFGLSLELSSRGPFVGFTRAHVPQPTSRRPKVRAAKTRGRGKIYMSKCQLHYTCHVQIISYSLSYTLLFGCVLCFYFLLLCVFCSLRSLYVSFLPFSRSQFGCCYCCCSNAAQQQLNPFISIILAFMQQTRGCCFLSFFSRCFVYFAVHVPGLLPLFATFYYCYLLVDFLVPLSFTIHCVSDCVCV